MNNLKRQITYQSNQRMVNGIPVNRDADFGIIFEKNSHLNLAKKILKIKNKDVDFYVAWDKEVIYITLDTGAVVAMTYAQGPAYAASAVERLVRTGVSHILRIGTCGSLDENISPWTVMISNAAIRDEATTDAYLPKEFPSFADMDFTSHLFKSFLKVKDFKTKMGIAITNCARYCENPVKMTLYNKKGNAKSIDMETSVILLVSFIYGVSASSISVVMDSPNSSSLKDDSHDSGSLGVSHFHGTPNHSDYAKFMEKRIIKIIEEVMKVYSEISSKNYSLMVNHHSFNKEIKAISP